MTDKKPAHRTVELVRSDYQPSRAELDDEWEVPEGLTFEQITKAVMQPVNVRWTDKPRNRRK